MSCPLSSAELREIICKLERLEVWQKQQETESKASGSQSKGYGRGDPKARAAALLSKTGPPPVPALEHIATRWKITEEEGPPFSGPEFTSIESGTWPTASSGRRPGGFCIVGSERGSPACAFSIFSRFLG